MKRRQKRSSFRPGLAPGTIVDRDEVVYPLEITVIDYTLERAETRTGAPIDSIEAPPEGVNRWIRVRGTPTSALLDQISDEFDVHPLVLEDIISTSQRIKVEDYETGNFTALRVLRETDATFEEFELSLLLSGTTLITVFETDDAGFFSPVADRLANAASLIRHHGVDFLYHAVIDLVVDCYFPILQSMEELSSETESRILDGAEEEHLRTIHTVRRSTQLLRGTLWSTRDVLSRIERSTHRFVANETLFYFRDISDHVVHLLDSLSTLRDAANAMMELYMSNVSNRLNQIMKVLTIISTVFIPISFIAGLYGMNFRFMPELEQRWAYPAVLGLMGLVVITMLVFFRRRKWF